MGTLILIMEDDREFELEHFLELEPPRRYTYSNICAPALCRAPLHSRFGVTIDNRYPALADADSIRVPPASYRKVALWTS